MKLFEKNVGKTDRIIRFVLGLLLFAAGALYLGSPLAYAAYFVGLVLIATGALGTCALYSLLKFTTLEQGEGCKCKEGEPCECKPECEVCNEEAPAKPAAPSKKEAFSIDIPEEAEEEEKPVFFAPEAQSLKPEPEPARAQVAKKAAKAPAKKVAPKKAEAKTPAKKAAPKAKKPAKKKKK
jgi:hypothetical protein